MWLNLVQFREAGPYWRTVRRKIKAVDYPAEVKGRLHIYRSFLIHLGILPHQPLSLSARLKTEKTSKHLSNTLRPQISITPSSLHWTCKLFNSMHAIRTMWFIKKSRKEALKSMIGIWKHWIYPDQLIKLLKILKFWSQSNFLCAWKM